MSMYYSFVYRRALHRAAQVLGDYRALARHLGVPAWEVVPWMDGRSLPPLPIFLRCIDVVLDDAARQPDASPLTVAGDVNAMRRRV